MKKQIFAVLLAAAALPAMAGDYYLVVPVKGRSAAQPTADIRVALAPGSLPAARVAAAYAYDLKQHLSVTGDSAYTGAGVSWSVASGALPAGLALDSASGSLQGTPSAAGDYAFGVQASYRAKVGVQSYSLSVAQPAARLISVGSKTFMLVSPAMTNWTAAQATCAQPINGTTGWRLPSMDDYNELFVAKGTAGINAAGWPTDQYDWYWSSDAYNGSRQEVTRPWNNTMSICDFSSNCAIAACVK